MGKKLVINAAVCDLRGITEEKAKAYDSMDINAACIFTSPEAKKTLLATTVNMNSAQTIVTTANIKVVPKNGSFTIQKGSIADADTFLLVNGSLEIEPGSVEAVKSYYGIVVNGEVICPESAAEALSSITVNGCSSTYPDHKIMFDGKVDAVFLARLQDGDDYFTRNTVYLLDQTDYSPLKNVTVQAPAAYIFESFVPAAAKIFSRSTAITTVPDGTAAVRNCPALTAAAIAKHGSKLLVESDLEIIEQEALDRLEYLKITGTAYVKEELLPLPDCVHVDSVVPYRSRIIRGIPNIDLDLGLLEAETQGVMVSDCAAVTIADDIPPALIRERLLIYDCAVVRCSAEQRGAVTAVSHDIASVVVSEDVPTAAEDSKFDAVEEINAAVYSI